MIETLAIIAACASGIVGLAYLDKAREVKALQRKNNEAKDMLTMDEWETSEVMGDLKCQIATLHTQLSDALDSSDRQASAITALHTRLDRIQEQVTPSANATVKRMAAIARGEA